MAILKTSVEYVGFRNTKDRREYHLRSHAGPESRDFTVGIALAAFAAGRVRLQDGPEICYLKLQHELEAGDALDGADFTVTDQELAGYREAHTPVRRASPSAAAAATHARPATAGQDRRP